MGWRRGGVKMVGYKSPVTSVEVLQTTDNSLDNPPRQIRNESETHAKDELRAANRC